MCGITCSTCRLALTWTTMAFPHQLTGMPPHSWCGQCNVNTEKPTHTQQSDQQAPPRIRVEEEQVIIPRFSHDPRWGNDSISLGRFPARPTSYASHPGSLGSWLLTFSVNWVTSIFRKERKDEITNLEGVTKASEMNCVTIPPRG